MPLISVRDYQARAAARPRLKVAILVFEGVQIIDFCGPYEVFGQAGYDVFTVGAKAAPLLTAMKLQITPTYALGASPAADILLIPGGNINGARRDAATLDWIRARHAESKITMSVCNGALILAQTGLLDGLSATTYHDAIDNLASDFARSGWWITNASSITARSSPPRPLFRDRRRHACRVAHGRQD